MFFAHDMWCFSAGCHQTEHSFSSVLNEKTYNIYGLDCFANRFLRSQLIKRFEEKRNSYLGENVRMIAPSVEFLDKIEKSNVIEKRKIFLIPNILDISKFAPKKAGNEKKIRVLYGAMGGKSNPYKGWSDFLYFAEKIDKILQSDAINYLETSERLILKNILDKETISELEVVNLDKIMEKYEKFIKN